MKNLLNLRRKLPKLLLLVGFGLFFAVLLGGVSGKRALAYNTTDPIQASAPETDSANIYGSGTNIQPWFAVGEGAYDGQYSYAKVYVPAGQTATLTVVQGNGVCGNIDVGSPMVNYETWTLTSAEKEASRISLQSNSGSCGALKFNLSGGTPSGFVGHKTYDVYYFQASIVGPGVGDNEKNFRLSVSNGLVGVSRPVGAVGQKPWFGIYMRDAPQRGGNNWDYAVQFAPYCNETTNNPQQPIAIHDIDYGVYPQPNLLGSVDKDDRADSAFSWILAPPGYTSGVGATTSKRVAPNDWPSGNLTNTNLTFNYDNTYRYLLQFRDVDWHNTIQVSLPFDQFDAKQTVGTACEGAQKPIAACTPSAPTQVASGANVTINVQLFNNSDPNGGPTFPTSYYFRQINYNNLSPGGPQYQLPRTLAPGGSPISFSFSPTPRTNQTVQFYFSLFDGSLSTSNFITKSPLCGIKITWGTSNTPGDLYTSCTLTRVPAMPSSATYTHTVTTYPSGYWTIAPPSTWPPNGPVPAPLDPAFINFVNPKYFYTPPPQVTVQTLPATIVPFYIHFDGSDGSSRDTQVYTTPVGQPYDFPNTFGSFNWMRPQFTYTATLYAQTSGDLGQDQNGPYGNPWTQIGAPQSLDQCMLAHLSGPFPNVCGGGSGTNVVIGQSASISYTLNIDNQTNNAFNGVGYNILLQPNSPQGVQITSANPVGVDIPAGPGNVSIVANYTIVVNFSGNYSVVFRYGGSTLDTLGPDGWDGTCPGGAPLVAQALPYLQAWNGSVSAGGGYRNPGPNDSGSCDQTAPSYVSPVTYGGNQDYGGIRAFGQQNAPNRGSRADFGVSALGMVIGNPGGTAGFFTGGQAAGNSTVFSNNAGSPVGYLSTSMGGYLNSNSTGHCASDFYTNTQVSPTTSTGSLAGDLADCVSKGGRCQYDFSNSFGDLTDSNITIPAGVQITIYVNHDVTINGNITYANFNPNDQTNVPYFALVVKGGNVTLTGNVSRLEGLYVVQPSGASGGEFITCDDLCNNQLVVNGAVIAQHVQLLRNHGNLYNPPSVDASITGNPAEIFNFVPSLIIGQPAFAAEFGSPESVISLPPVF